MGTVCMKIDRPAIITIKGNERQDPKPVTQGRKS